MAAVTLLSGPLYDRFGVDGFFAMVGDRAGRAWPDRCLRRAQPQSAGSRR